jgi:hypothetical protein
MFLRKILVAYLQACKEIMDACSANNPILIYQNHICNWVGGSLPVPYPMRYDVEDEKKNWVGGYRGGLLVSTRLLVNSFPPERPLHQRRLVVSSTRDE